MGKFKIYVKKCKFMGNEAKWNRLNRKVSATHFKSYLLANLKYYILEV